MPVFGKGRKGRVQKKFLEKEVTAAKQMLEGKRSNARVYRQRAIYEYESTPHTRLFFPLVFKPRNNFIEKRYAKKKKPVVVVDWGCGKGVAIEWFAKKYKDRINAIGFSKDSFKEWEQIENARIIHSTKEGLLRYLKDSSVDLIYSRFGLAYLFMDPNQTKAVNYLRKLLKKLSQSGIIAFNPFWGEPYFPQNLERFKTTLEKECLVKICRPEVYLIKK